MYAATAALAAEIFGKNRAQLLITGVVAPIAWWLARALLSATGPHLPALLSDAFALVVGCCLAVHLAALFSYVDLTAGAKTEGFPQHILVLPVPTWLLALVPIASGSLFIAAFVLLWIRFICELRLTGVEQLAIAATVTSLLCWTQAMSWELLRQRFARLGALVVIFVATILSLISLLAREADFLFGRAGGLAGLLLTTLSGYGLAHLAVTRSRRGDAGRSMPRAGASRSRESLASSPSRKLTLGNGVAAQEWFEWRVFGRLLPGCMLFFAGLYLLMLIFEPIRERPSLIELTLVAWTFFIVAPLAGGGFASRSAKLARVELGSLYLTRPLTNLELAFSKLRVTVKSHLVSLLIVLVVLTLVILVSHDNKLVIFAWSILKARQGVVAAALCVLLAAALASVVTWVAGAYFMSGRLFFAGVDQKRHRWKIVLGILVVAAALLQILVKIRELQAGILPWMEQAHGTMLIPPAVAIAIGLALVPHFQRSTALAALRPVAMGYGGVLGFCLLALLQIDLSNGYRWALICVAVTVTVAAFIPVLLLPILIGLHRHR